MNKPKIYAAGGMSGLTIEEASAWRKEIIEKVGENIEVLNPLRDQIDSDETTVIKDSSARSIFTNSKSLTRRDLNDIRNSDVVLFNFLNPKSISRGSLIELGFAAGLQKPIVVILDKSEEMYNHAFVKELAWYSISNINTAVKVIKSILNVS